MTSSSWFKPAELAERLNVTTRTVLEWIRSGELFALQLGVGLKSKKPRYRISEDALEAFLQGRQPVPKRLRRKLARPGRVAEFYK